MDIQSKIKEIEEEIRRTKVHKGTEFHIGILKAKLAKLRSELKEKRKGKGKGFDIKRTGDASVVLLGFPSVGKSTLLNQLTNADSKVAPYEFTTLDVIPGMMEYKGAKIQILDIPGIIGGGGKGAGKGKTLFSVAKNSELLIIVLDRIEQLSLIEEELNEAGIRINQKPEVNIINSNEKYIPALIVLNKIDLLSEESLRKIDKRMIPISAEKGINIERLKEEMYKRLDFIRVYLKSKNEKECGKPLIIKKGSRVKDVCSKIHKELLKEFGYALIWGSSAKFEKQRVGLEHLLNDEDILMIVKRRGRKWES